MIATFHAGRISQMLFAMVALVLTLVAHAEDSTSATSYGVHGMALFGGKDALFASHLPMFHAPHDQQIILQIEILDPAVQHSVSMELERRPELWTLNPEPFALDALWQTGTPLREFNAEIIQGHFERGGSSRFKSAKIRVVQVAFHTQLSANSSAHKGYATYQLLHVGTTNFLFKHIIARPDFDHIVKIASALATDSLQVETMPDMATREAILKQVLGAQFLQSVYLDDADLK